MVNYMDANPDIGVLDHALNPDKSVQSSAVVFRQWQPFLSSWLGPHMLLLSCCKLIMQKIFADDAVADVDWVMGTAMLVPAHVVTQIGGMDEAYFMYSGIGLCPAH